MADPKIDNWTIFYSWQSDLPFETNQGAIRIELRNVISELETATLKIALDEATRETPGSPDIPATIFEKISVADIFVCDLTTINHTAPPEFRRTPNPNVLIELGYAVAVLGWERIVLLFNKTHGVFPDDLPFDVDRRRFTHFTIKDGADKSGKGNLKAILLIAITSILKAKPLKPDEKKKLTPEEQKRRLDIGNIKWALKAINIQIMDEFIEQMPRVIQHRILHFWEGFRGVMESSSFHIFDEQTKQLIVDFYRHWEISLSFPEMYRSTPSNNLIFGPPYDMPYNAEEQNAWNILMNEKVQLNLSFRKLLKHIREHYMEIDLDETSTHAIQEFARFQIN